MKIRELLAQIKPYVLGWIRDYQTTGQVRANNVPRFVGLSSPLTSASWNLSAYSTTAKTLLDLSSVFGAPAGIKAVLFRVGVRDSGSNGTDTYLVLSPNDTAGEGMGFSPFTVNDRECRGCLVVPCNAEGDVYYQIAASGSGTFDVLLQIWGYWL